MFWFNRSKKQMWDKLKQPAPGPIVRNGRVNYFDLLELSLEEATAVLERVKKENLIVR